MKLSNKEIYSLATNLNLAFSEREQVLPIKFYFPILKNKKNLTILAEEIESARNLIFKTYGIFDEEKKIYHFPEDKIDIVNKELSELLLIEQEVPLLMISLDELEKNKSLLKICQIEAIFFMIQDKKEAKI